MSTAPDYVIPVPIQLRFHPSQDLNIRCDKNYVPTSPPSQVIYYSRDANYEYNGVIYHSITYYVYYTINPAIGMNGILPSATSLGYHPKDIERIRILYNIGLNPIPQHVFYSAHDREGKWLKWGDAKKTKDGNLIVYVCYGSHAHRPSPGTYLRIFGFANDYASNMGAHVVPRLEEDNSMSHPIYNKYDLDTGIRAFLMPFFLSK